MNVLGFAHAWLLSFGLGAFFAAIILVPALLLGIRLRVGEVLEIVCWLALAVLALAEVTAVA